MSERLISGLLRFAVAANLFGWGWQHLVWSVPYSEIYWNEERFGWFVRLLGVDWDAYTRSAQAEQWLTVATQGVGSLYLILGVVALRCRALGLHCGMWLASVLLAFLAYCDYLNRMQMWVQGVELASQVLAPVLLWMFASGRCRFLPIVAAFAVTLTFLGHGLYALGVFPVPAHFQTMTMNILGVTQSQALFLLLIAGILDVVVCVGLWIPALRGTVLLYAVFWGTVTALARPWDLGLGTGLHEFFKRAPHAVIPLLLWWSTRRPSD